MWQGKPLIPPLSIRFLIFTLFFLFLLSFLIRSIFFLLLSIPSLSTRIAPLHFQARGCRK